MPLELLPPEELSRITDACRDNPNSRMVLRWLLSANYFWHVSRNMLGAPSHISTIDWNGIERNTAQLIRNTFEKLLPAVQTTRWNGRIPDHYEKV